MCRSEASTVELFFFSAGSRQLQPTGRGLTGELGSDGSLEFLLPFSEKIRKRQSRGHSNNNPAAASSAIILARIAVLSQD